MKKLLAAGVLLAVSMATNAQVNSHNWTRYENTDTTSKYAALDTTGRVRVDLIGEISIPSVMNIQEPSCTSNSGIFTININGVFRDGTYYNIIRAGICKVDVTGNPVAVVRAIGGLETLRLEDSKYFIVDYKLTNGRPQTILRFELKSAN